ncbi:hypothetical protein BN946_scf184939.g20 [Trametes cinnabarina]|uniref:Uncharacterized protein n=1 Tax=Pycnoporus cinnabarinus TaxID=5643 RepID=A0A060SC86_PYCCI|nr:hypothetical protein BN946_scf184939.g20 [Trametes cinnabarina]
MLTILASFLVVCVFASYASTSFALRAAKPMYGIYPSLVAAMLVGGVYALICYLPAMLAVGCFAYLFDTDIRQGGTVPPGLQPARHDDSRYLDVLRSLLRDGADTTRSRSSSHRYTSWR